MIYSKFRIKNFKGIDEVIIDLINNRIITLVGINESGKTSIMEGINLFYKSIKQVDIPEEILNEYRPKGIDFTGNIEIEASLFLDSDDKEKIKIFWKEALGKRRQLDISDEFSYTFKFEFELHSFKERNKVCGFEIKTTTSTRSLHSTDKESWLKIVEFIKENMVPEILYYDDFIFEIPKKICFIKSGHPNDTEVSEKNNITWQSVINDILHSVNPDLVFQDHIVDTWENDNDAAINRLAQMEKSLNEKITSKWRALFREDKINFKEIKLDPRYSANKLNLSFKIRAQDNTEFSVRERSKGFKWFFSFLLFTEFRKKRTDNILFLLDEPASNLHSSAQAKILEALEELSKDSLVIYSTHSQHLIKPEWLSGAYICINEYLSEQILSGSLNLKEGAKISAIKYYTYVGTGLGSDRISYFQPILDRLQYTPSSLDPSIPNIVILEGKNDWYTLKYFSEVILNNKYKLNFYPGAGRNKLWDIIRLYLAWGKTFVVVLDGDQPSIDAKKSYEEEFGDFIKGRIFTLKDLIDLTDTTEGAIEEHDKISICDSIYGTGSYNKIKHKKTTVKKNLNYAINQLLVQNKKVKISRKTTDRFRSLFKEISKRFAIPHS